MIEPTGPSGHSLIHYKKKSVEKQQLFDENFIKMKSGKTGATALLWAVTALAAGGLLLWQGLDAGNGAPQFTPAEPEKKLASSAPVDVNAAVAEELDDLPGVGPVLAERIVAFREENGPFESPEDVMDVPGVGPALYEDIAPYIGGQEEAEGREDTGR